MVDRTVYFDLGDTLGTATLAGQPPRLDRFHVFGFVHQLLGDLAGQGYRLGIISNTGDERFDRMASVLDEAGIFTFFDPALCVFSGDLPLLPPKPDPSLFEEARRRAPAGTDVVFVGEDAREREAARGAGFTVVPHPNLLQAVLAGEQLRYVRLSPETVSASPWLALEGLSVVPLQVTGGAAPRMQAIAAESAVAEAIGRGFGVELLGPPGLPDLTDLFLLRDDRGGRSGLVAPGLDALARVDDLHVVAAERDGYLAVLTGSADIDAAHIRGSEHGHILKLMPQPMIATQAAFAAPRPVAWEHGTEQTEIFDDVTGQELLASIAALSGAVPLAEGGPTIRSRHLAHPDNAAAVDHLQARFEDIAGGVLLVRRQRFTHRGRSLDNLEAELPGLTGQSVIVSAHLDSTAGNDEGFDPRRDPAPGADDDASGVAAVLALAGRFARLAASGWRPQRTLRFVLFNAEEEGLVGSQAYARLQQASGNEITAVLQMDMIGFNPDRPGRWEVHAGSRANLSAEAASLAVARLLRDVGAAESATMETLQVYSSEVAGGDPADGRSDHGPFHALGAAAVAISTDFFAGPGPEAPAPSPNENYHSAADRIVHPEPLAAVVRSVGRAAWILATTPSDTLQNGRDMTSHKQFDSRPFARSQQIPDLGESSGSASDGAKNLVFLGRQGAGFEPASAPTGDFGARAVAFVKDMLPRGFGASPEASFIADPVVTRTSAGAASVHVLQYAKGVPLFQTSRIVRFGPEGAPVDAPGNTAFVPEEFDILPKIDVRDAATVAAAWVAEAHNGAGEPDAYGGTQAPEPIEVADWTPELKIQFQLPARPTVLASGPFEVDIAAQLVVFVTPERPRLGWQYYFTLPDHTAHYLVIVSADLEEAELLYAKNMDNHARAKGLVYETSPGIATRTSVTFPRSLSDYPVMPSAPIAGFPHDWVEAEFTVGNATFATLNTTTTSLRGTANGGIIDFSPADDDGDDQKLLNIFYFCNYMHDFLYVLGFDEASGNFQKRNFTLQGIGNDSVRARAHSGPVFGTANMSTPPDGSAPTMNMGLVAGSGRHTAFDADVVFHEFVHGLTNRLVGGGMTPRPLDAPQSGGMGEGWSDFYALTVVNWATGADKTVTGDWVINDPTGIRRHPYDEAYPVTYGKILDQFGGGNPNKIDEHDSGEVWCASLMSFTRRARAALGDGDGYRVAWQCVTDGLKLTPANPTFLEARDAILRAIDDLKTARRLSPAQHKVVRKAAWEAFAKFGMGVDASSEDPGWEGIVEDSSVPADL